MKLKGASPFRRPGGGGGYFVEIRAGSAAPTVTSDVSCSDLSSEEVGAVVGQAEYVVFGRLGCGGDAEDAPEGLEAASVDGSCASSDVISVASVELSWMTKHLGRKAEEETSTEVDHETEDFGGCKSDISEDLGAKHGGNLPEGEVSCIVSSNPTARAHVGIEKQLLMHYEQYMAILQVASAMLQRNRQSIAFPARSVG